MLVAIGERVVSSESLAQTIEKYLPKKETLEAYLYPDPVSLERKKIFEEKLPGAKYALVNSIVDKKLVLVPTWHPLNTTPIPTHGADYGSGAFEGGSAEPVVNEDGEIVGANIILHEPKMRRLFESAKARDFPLSVPLEDFSRGIIDLVSVQGFGALISAKGVPCRAYIRPEARPGIGSFGVGVKKGHLIDMACVSWNWPYYFKDPERVYKGSGLVVALTPEQRLPRITGKHASNYGEAGVVGNRARDVYGVDEALYLGPYLIEPIGRRRKYIDNQDPTLSTRDLLDFGVIADGPGEEVFAITDNGEIWYPPMDVNRLGGTTLSYLTDYMIPTMGKWSNEARFSLSDIKRGKIVCLLFVGNAAKIAPIGEIRVFDAKSTSPLETIKLEIPPLARELMERYEAEILGRIPPSHASLLTPVNLAEGLEARKVLDKVYSAWI